MGKRRVKSKGKSRGAKKVAIHKFKGKPKPKPEPRETKRDADENGPAAVHKFSGRKDAAGADASASSASSGTPPAKGGLAARLAAMAAASAELGEEQHVEVKSKSSTSASAAGKGGVEWQDLEDEDDDAVDKEGHSVAIAPTGQGKSPSPDASDGADDEPVFVKTKTAVAEVDPGISVVAKGASKFSASDLELLRAAIKVKGSGAVVEGINLDELKWDGEGLVPVIAQDRRTGAVLTVGHANRETLEATLRSKQMTYWNRNTGKAVTQGQESGHPQRLVRIAVDCDKDAILALVEQEGPACHRDTGTCFHDERSVPVASFLGELDRIVKERAKDPEPDSKTSKLLAEPIEALRGFVEQANELTRVVQGKSKGSLETAAADLLYNLVVTLRTKGIGLGEALTELQAQHMAMQMRKGKE